MMMDERMAAAAIARLEATVQVLTVSVAEMRAEAKLQTRQLALIEAQLSEAKGGLRVVLWVGGVASAIVSGVAVWAANHLQLK